MRQSLRFVSACGIVLGTALLSACGFLPSFGSDDDARPVQGRQADEYQQAMAYKQNDECSRAIPLLEPMAKRGHGFEVAQYELGQCLLTTARTASSPADAARTRADGAAWILKAANSQIPAAQQAAIQLYEEGIGVPADPLEAAKWLLLLERNPLRRVFGPAAIDAELEKWLREKLTAAQWAEAQDRADRWQPVDQPTVVPPPETQKSER